MKEIKKILRDSIKESLLGAKRSKGDDKISNGMRSVYTGIASGLKIAGKHLIPWAFDRGFVVGFNRGYEKALTEMKVVVVDKVRIHQLAIRESRKK